MPQTWATVTMLKEPPEVVLDFVAHHVCMGASEIFLYFDDPADPAIELVEKLPQVRAIRCTAAHWAAIGAHLPSHEARQKANANHARDRTTCDWIIHLDADEMVHSDGLVGDHLTDVAADAVRLSPFEAFDLPRAGQGKRPEFRFRGALPRGPKGVRLGEAAYGEFAASLTQGMLSHAAGKFFVRTGDPALRMAIHGPFRDGVRAPASGSGAMRLLHFHGSSWDKWRRHLEFRLQTGAYATHLQPRKARAIPRETLFARLRRLRTDEGEDGLKRFYRQVCTFGPEKRVLARAGALLDADLWLADKRKAVFDQASAPAPVWPFEVRRVWRGLTFLLTPDDVPVERLLTRGIGWPEAAADLLSQALAGKLLRMVDFGPGPGTFSLVAARVAREGSTFQAIDPARPQRERFARTCALNGRAISAAADITASGPEPDAGALTVAHVDTDRRDCLGLFLHWAGRQQPDLVIASGSAESRARAVEGLQAGLHLTDFADEATTILTRQPNTRT